MTGPFDPVSTFLSVVQPWITGTYVNIEAYDWEPKAGGQPGDGVLSRRKGSRACQDLAEATNYVRWQNSQNREVYLRMAAHRQPGTARTDKRGRTYYSALGGAANAVSLKSLFIDVDVKNRAHKTPQEAQGAVAAMCATLGLPLPSIAVWSGGGGFHAHWVLTRHIPVADWLVLARRMAAACRQHGVHADHNLTVNPVCLLRVPGTSNRKYGDAREVRLEILGAAVDPDDLMRTLEGFADTAPPPKNPAGTTPGVASQILIDPVLFPVGKPVALGEQFLGGISSPAHTLEEIAVGCPLVRETLKTGGRGNPEPLWYAMAHICVFTEGEAADFHRLSNGDPRYDTAATDAKFERAQKEKHDKDMGWPRCATLNLTLGNTSCAGCSHLKENKSPLNFAAQAIPDDPEVTQPGNEDHPQGPGESGEEYTPDAFKVLDVAGYITDQKAATYSIEETDRKGNIREVLIWDYPVWNLDYKRDTRLRYAIHFDTKTGTDEYVHVVLPTSALVDTTGLRACLVDRYGLGVNTDHSKGILNFMTAFQSQMRQTLARVSRQELMGWIEDPKGGHPLAFIYGPNRYSPSGATSFFQPDPMIKAQYFPSGSLEPWLAAVRMINAEQRPEMDLLVATAFAAPLMRFTGEKGVVISAYSSGTAVHKTSAIKVGQSVWGAFKGINQLDDTLNSVMARVGQTRITPTYYDEMKSSLDIKKFASMLYTFTGGRGKGRLNRNAEIRDVDTWDTLLVGVSNDSLFDFISQMDRSTDAGVARIFEFEVGPPTPGVGQVSMGEAGEILKALETNYGHAGARYAEYLGKSVAWLPDAVKKTVNSLQGKLNADGTERFWVSAAAVLLLGAQMANDIGLTKFDLARMAKFIEQTFAKMRVARLQGDLDISKKDSVRALLASFLNNNRRSILATDIMGQSGRAGAMTPVTILNHADLHNNPNFMVRYVRDPQPLMRLSRNGITDWLKKNDLSAPTVIKNMVEHFGGKTAYRNITAGTSLRNAREHVIELDLTHPDLVDLYEID